MCGLEVGRGRVRVSKCARWCMCYMRSCKGRMNRERWLLCYRCSSLSQTHTSKIEDRSLMYTQRIDICLCLTHAWSFAHSHLSMSVSHAHRLHIALPPQHTYGHIHTFSLSHTHKISIKKTRVHLKRPNPNKHELELNSNIWKYCSVKNFHKKKSWVIFKDFFTHKKGSVDVLRARHGDTPFDRPRGRGSRACTWFRIVVVVLTNKCAA